MLSLIGTLKNKAGFAEIAERDADPHTVSHISAHPGGMDVRDANADCGFPFAESHAGRLAPTCAYCADLHSDQPWIQNASRR